jgi:hypothetical protein
MSCNSPATLTAALLRQLARVEPDRRGMPACGQIARAQRADEGAQDGILERLQIDRARFELVATLLRAQQ